MKRCSQFMHHKSYYLTWQEVPTVRNHNGSVNSTQKPNPIPQSFFTKQYALMELPDLLPCWCDSNALHYYSGGNGFQSWPRNQISSDPPCKQHDRASIMARPHLWNSLHFTTHQSSRYWTWKHHEINYKEMSANGPHAGPAESSCARTQTQTHNFFKIRLNSLKY
jgi:hypothetical protein